MALANDFRHLYIFGTAGEGYAVNTARFQQIVQIFREEARGEDIHPQVGVIGLSTANIVERIAFVHAAGFRVFQISLPSWGALNDVELLTFFKDVCGAFPEAQFLYYNLPRAKRLLGGALNVYRAAQEAGVWRAVFMSSGSTMCGYKWYEGSSYGKLAANEIDRLPPDARMITHTDPLDPIASTALASRLARTPVGCSRIACVVIEYRPMVKRDPPRQSGGQERAPQHELIGLADSWY
jgi:hypothetical protein